MGVATISKVCEESPETFGQREGRLQLTALVGPPKIGELGARDLRATPPATGPAKEEQRAVAYARQGVIARCEQGFQHLNARRGFLARAVADQPRGLATVGEQLA
jgi:hypothetical protein